MNILWLLYGLGGVLYWDYRNYVVVKGEVYYYIR